MRESRIQRHERLPRYYMLTPVVGAAVALAFDWPWWSPALVAIPLAVVLLVVDTLIRAPSGRR